MPMESSGSLGWRFTPDPSKPAPPPEGAPDTALPELHSVQEVVSLLRQLLRFKVSDANRQQKEYYVHQIIPDFEQRFHERLDPQRMGCTTVAQFVDASFPTEFELLQDGAGRVAVKKLMPAAPVVFAGLHGKRPAASPRHARCSVQAGSRAAAEPASLASEPLLKRQHVMAAPHLPPGPLDLAPITPSVIPGLASTPDDARVQHKGHWHPGTHGASGRGPALGAQPPRSGGRLCHGQRAPIGLVQQAARAEPPSPAGTRVRAFMHLASGTAGTAPGAIAGAEHRLPAGAQQLAAGLVAAEWQPLSSTGAHEWQRSSGSGAAGWRLPAPAVATDGQPPSAIGATAWQPPASTAAVIWQPPISTVAADWQPPASSVAMIWQPPASATFEWQPPSGTGSGGWQPPASAASSPAQLHQQPVSIAPGTPQPCQQVPVALPPCSHLFELAPWLVDPEAQAADAARAVTTAPDPAAPSAQTAAAGEPPPPASSPAPMPPPPSLSQPPPRQALMEPGRQQELLLPLHSAPLPSQALQQQQQGWQQLHSLPVQAPHTLHSVCWQQPGTARAAAPPPPRQQQHMMPPQQAPPPAAWHQQAPGVLSNQPFQGAMADPYYPPHAPAPRPPVLHAHMLSAPPPSAGP